MKIAAITITLNDGFKFNEWYQHYLEYKDELYMHIIVDNGSDPEYLVLVESFFTDSIIIKRQTNGGCTIAYNDGLKIALANRNVDSIMLIGNDIKLPLGNITKLYDFLNSNLSYGMVAPILLSKDSDRVENYDCKIGKYSLLMKSKDNKRRFAEIEDEFKIVDTVPGGINIATKKFYETIGLQDEDIFMYTDEVDTGLRAKNHKFKMAVTKTAKAWHQHINPNNEIVRKPYAAFLMGRNGYYIGKKNNF